MMNRSAAWRIGVLLVLAVAGLAAGAMAFTYQGIMAGADGAPLAGVHDVQFALYDAAAAGTQVGPTVEMPNMAVTAGRFAASLDFGATAFPGLPRWLEVRMRPAGTDVYTILTPRTAITPTPYALTAFSVAPGVITEAALDPGLAARLGGPVAAGVVESDGSIIAGTRNLRVTRTATANYSVYIDGLVMTNTTYLVQVTARSTTNIFATASVRNGYAEVCTYLNGGGPQDSGFAITIMSVAPLRYAVSGRVVDPQGAAVPDVRMYVYTSFTTSAGDAQTDATGAFTVTGILGGGTLAPQLTGYAFEPAAVAITGAATGVTFTAYPLYTASGRVTDAQSRGIAGATVDFGNPRFSAVTTDGQGRWTKDSLIGTVTATASKTDWTFAPASRTLTGAATDANFVAATFPLAGTVRQANLNALAGVTFAFSDGAPSVISDSLGNWRRAGIAGAVTITPASTGWTFTPTTIIVDDPTDVADFIATYTASGIVADLQAAPVAGATVSFTGGIPATSVTTDATGRWTAGGLSGNYTVSAGKAGWTWATSIGINGPTTNASTLYGSYAVSGHVRNADGQPIASAAVTVSNAGQFSTNAAGVWSVGGLSGTRTATPALTGWTFTPSSQSLTGPSTAADFAGTYEVTLYARVGTGSTGIANVAVAFDHGIATATADTFGTLYKAGLPGAVVATPTKAGWTFSPATMTLTGPSATLLYLRATYTVSGVVRDTLGTPIAGVTISANSKTATTDAAGAWQISGLDTNANVVPSLPGYAFSPANIVSTGPDTAVNFAGSYTVSGHVTDGRGAVSTGVTFSGDAVAAFNGTAGWTKSGLAGTVTVTPEQTGWTFVPASRQVTGPASNLDFDASYTVSGRVLDWNGVPVAGATVRFGDGTLGVPDATTAADGRWSQSGLRYAYRVSALKTGWYFMSVLDAVGPNSALEHKGSYEVSGFVRDAQGNPLAGIRVNTDEMLTTTTDATGAWRISGINTQSTRVHAWETLANYYFTTGYVSITGPQTGIVFTGERYYMISGKVVDSAAQPVAGVTINYGSGSLTTLDGGTWSAYAHGTATVTATRAGLSFTPASYTVSAANNAVDFVVGHTASGVVRTSARVPIAGVTVSFSNGRPSVTTDDNGAWSQTGMVGAVTVTPTSSLYHIEPASQTSAAPGDLYFTGYPYYTVSGAVGTPAVPTPTPISGATISFTGGFASVTSAANGTWSKTNLWGTVTITPSKLEYVFTPASVVVTGARSNVAFSGN